jgi:hypothetical protein
MDRKVSPDSVLSALGGPAHGRISKREGGGDFCVVSNNWW